MAIKIEKIKQEIRNNLGNKCSVIAKQGRKKIVLKECIIDSVYSEIFVIKCLSEEKVLPKAMTFSYIDIFTKSVILFKYDSNLKIDA